MKSTRLWLAADLIGQLDQIAHGLATLVRVDPQIAAVPSATLVRMCRLEVRALLGWLRRGRPPRWPAPPRAVFIARSYWNEWLKSNGKDPEQRRRACVVLDEFLALRERVAQGLQTQPPAKPSLR